MSFQKGSYFFPSHTNSKYSSLSSNMMERTKKTTFAFTKINGQNVIDFKLEWDQAKGNSSRSYQNSPRKNKPTFPVWKSLIRLSSSVNWQNWFTPAASLVHCHRQRLLLYSVIKHVTQLNKSYFYKSTYIFYLFLLKKHMFQVYRNRLIHQRIFYIISF